MPIYSSDSDDQPASTARLFGRERPLHAILGGGKVADILLWRDKSLSAALLLGATMIWFLFEIVEYNFVSLLCHISILMMLVVFIIYAGSGFGNWYYPLPPLQNVPSPLTVACKSPPDIRDITIPEHAFRWLFSKINWLLLKFYDISSGKDFKQFCLALVSLWILSVVGNYFSSLNLLYTGFVCMEIIPALYERYEREVDYLASRGNRDVKKLYKNFDSKVLTKIPRGPVKEKKFR
ncbi:hypothetical protein RJ639_006534 [Escallonia herrerae]|uniref:Reticulon-like protein n=1 Tax=Escallonia herrerae TaxID=1293975 RepID=A0AA89AWM4_9ASTE|nr:hypothetical protein RJ639_006534 [Escallonia herrerae]